MSTRRKAERPYNEVGRCSWRGTRDLPKGRRLWCSAECVDAYRLVADPGFVREKLRERDGGICALCGCDADAEYRRWKEARKELARLAEWFASRARMRKDLWGKVGYWRLREECLESLAAKYGLDQAWTTGRRSGWDADHVVPVAEGGGECDLDNFRTLCHPCHKRVTAELAARLAQRRRVERTGQPELFGAGEV